MEKKPWKEEEVKRLLELHDAGKTSKQIKRALKQEFKVERSIPAIYTRYSVVTKDERADLKDAPKSGLAYNLTIFDKSNFRPLISQRLEKTYSTLESQAIAIREYDMANKYRDMTVPQLMALEEKKRQEISSMINTGGQIEPVKSIDLLLVPNSSNDGATVILPLYHKDSKEISDSSLRTELRDYVVMLLEESGLKQAEKFKDTFRDLMAYNFSGNPKDASNLGIAVLEMIKPSHPTVEKVSLFVDDPYFYNGVLWTQK